jgi:hypothetical protein
VPLALPVLFIDPTLARSVTSLTIACRPNHSRRHSGPISENFEGKVKANQSLAMV